MSECAGIPRRRTDWRRFAAFLLLSCVLGSSMWSHASQLKPDEELMFFPGIARKAADGSWQISIEGCVYEPEHRWAALALLRSALHAKNINPTPEETELLNQRARLFMTDHERRKDISVAFGERRLTFSKTAADGWLHGTFRLTNHEIQALAVRGTNGALELSFSACLPQNDARVFRGRIFLVPDAGLLVVSDIDDTLKLTEVGNNEAVLRNTFLKPFEPIAGMAALYRELSAQPGSHIAYLSASPWQLFPCISDFIERAGFPDGTFHLRQFRWNRKSVLDLNVPDKHKNARLRELLESFPNRKFVLIGDSGERDPEVYGALARERPSQVQMILIRQVEPAAPRARYEAAFRALNTGQWAVFTNATQALAALQSAKILP